MPTLHARTQTMLKTPSWFKDVWSTLSHKQDIAFKHPAQVMNYIFGYEYYRMMTDTEFADCLYFITRTVRINYGYSYHCRIQDAFFKCPIDFGQFTYSNSAVQAPQYMKEACAAVLENPELRIAVCSGSKKLLADSFRNAGSYADALRVQGVGKFCLGTTRRSLDTMALYLANPLLKENNK